MLMLMQKKLHNCEKYKKKKVMCEFNVVSSRKDEKMKR